MKAVPEIVVRRGGEGHALVSHGFRIGASSSAGASNAGASTALTGDEFQKILPAENVVLTQECVARLPHFIDHGFAGNQMAAGKADIAGTLVMIEICCVSLCCANVEGGELSMDTSQMSRVTDTPVSPYAGPVS
jgi:hypothetical protein